MHHKLILFLTCILLPCLAQLQDQTNEPLLEDNFDFLVNLTEDNFESKVLSDENERWLVMFYAPWCPHCHQAMPAFNEFAKTMKDQVNVGRVNCDANYALWHKYEINGYPTFLYFYQDKIYQYEGERTVDAWTEFVNEGYKKEQAKGVYEPKDLEDESTPINEEEQKVEELRKNAEKESLKKRSITELNKANFDDKVFAGKDERWFIMFYSPNCSTCEEVMSLFLTLPEQLNDEKICIGRVDIAQNPSLNSRFSSQNDPTFRYFYNGENREFEGQNTIEAWKDFIKRQFESVGSETEEIYERFQTENGTINVEDKLVQDNMTLLSRDNLTEDQNISQYPDLGQNVTNNETIPREGNEPVLTPEERQREENQTKFRDNATEYQNIYHNETVPTVGVREGQNIDEQNQTIPAPGENLNATGYPYNETIPIPGENLTQYQNISQDQNLPYNQTIEGKTDDLTLTAEEERLRRENETLATVGDNRTQSQDIDEDQQRISEREQYLNQNFSQNVSSNETLDRERDIDNLDPEERLRRENQTFPSIGDNVTEDQNIAGQNQTLPIENVTENQYNQTIPTPAENLDDKEYLYNETVPTPIDNLVRYQNFSQEQNLPQNTSYNETLDRERDNNTLIPEQSLSGENQTLPVFGENATEYQYNQTIPLPGENLTQDQNISQEQNLPQNISYNETLDRERDINNLDPEERLRRENQTFPRIGDNATEYQNITGQNQTLPIEDVTEYPYNQTIPAPEENLNATGSPYNETIPIPGENLTQYQNISQDQNLPYNQTIEGRTDNLTLTPEEERLRRENETLPGFGENLTQYQNISQPENLTQDLSDSEGSVTELTIDNFDSKVLSGDDERWFIMFYSESCPVCKSVLPLFQTLGRSLKDKVCIGRVNIDASPGLRDRFSAQDDPTFLFFHNGETRRFEGDKTIEGWTDFINVGLSKIGDIKENISETIEGAKDNITSTIDEKLRGQNETFPGFGENLTQYQHQNLTSYNETIPRDNVTLTPEEPVREENETLPGLEDKTIERLQTPPNEERFSTITELTADDFDSKVFSDTKKRWFIMFYSPECPVCDTVMPLFEKFAESAPSKLCLGKVNIDANPDLRDQFSILGHPTFIYFHNGGTRRFEGGERATEALNGFISEGIDKLEDFEEKSATDESDVSDVQDIEESPESITELSQDNFDQKVLPNGDRWFIMFYSPRCPHCKKAMPKFIELAESLKDQKDICIGRVDIDTNYNLQIQFAVNGHPTFLYYQNGELRQYEGPRTVEAWTEFINRGYRRSEIVEEDQPKLIEEDATHIESNETSSGRDVIWSEGRKDDTNAPEPDVVKERPPQQPIDEQIGANLPSSEPEPEIPATPEEPTITPDLEHTEVVKDLTSGDFDLDEGQRWFVMFYAPWCPHCKAAMPALEELAKTLDGHVNVGRIDCDANPEVLGRFGIQGYPTFIYFYQGQTHRYDGERTVEQWTLFINNDFPILPKEEAQEPETPSLIDEKSPALPEITEERADSVIDLTGGDFDGRVFSDDNSRWFVMFYAPWCPHCQHAMPAFNDLAQSLQGEINIARVNCVDNQDLCARFGVRGFPTFLYLYKGETRQFEGERTVEAWTEFVNTGYQKEEVKAEEEPKELEKEASPTTAEPEELITPDILREVVVLDNANFDQEVSGDQPWFIMFYAPWCPHCKHAMPAWKEFANSVQGRVNVGTVDCEANPELRSRFSINGYPTFIYVVNGERRQYEGPRTVEAWSSFIGEEYEKVEPKAIVTAVKGNDYIQTLGWIIFGTAMGVGLLLLIYLGLSQKKSEEPKYEPAGLEQDSFVDGTVIDVDRY